MATVLRPASASTGALGFLLADVVRLMRREFRSQAAGLKLMPALARLVFHVDRQPGCRQSDLAAILEVTPVTLGRMIDKLEQRDLVRRAPDTDDRRAVRIFLTKSARPLIARMDAIVDRVDVAPQIAGNVREVLVRENERVAAGQLLLLLDDELPKIAVAAADSRLAEARTEVAALQAGIVSHLPKVGARVEVGRAAFAILTDAAVFVEANFKETDLEYVRPGQRSSSCRPLWSGSSQRRSCSGRWAATTRRPS